MNSLKFISLVLMTGIGCSINTSVFSAPDCEEDIFYTNQDIGNDGNDGTLAQPFATIQQLILVLEQCIDDDDTGATPNSAKTGRVVATATPYTELGQLPGDAFAAISIQKGGNSTTERIILEGVAGSGLRRPTIDQRRESLGFFISQERGTTNLADFVTIRNFEVIGGSILTSTIISEENADIIIEQNYIHHVYGGDNIGLIRLDSCNSCVIRNNIMHDAYDVRANSNPINDTPYRFHSGVHGFEPGNSVIEKNIIFNVSKGVFIKTADQGGLNAHVVQNNILYNLAESAYVMQISGGGRPAPENAVFRNNLVYDAQGVASLSLAGASTQGNNLLIYNNTIVDTLSMAGLQSMENIEIFNNIHSGQTPSWGTMPSIQVAVNIDNLTGLNTTFDYFDNNFHFNTRELWVLDRNGPGEESLNQTGWLAATNVPGLGGATPEQNSIFSSTAPDFNDPTNRDYSLNSATGVTGRGNTGSAFTYPTAIGAGVTISGGAPHVISNWDGNATGNSGTQLGPDANIFDDIPAQISDLTVTSFL